MLRTPRAIVSSVSTDDDPSSLAFVGGADDAMAAVAAGFAVVAAVGGRTPSPVDPSPDIRVDDPTALPTDAAAWAELLPRPEDAAHRIDAIAERLDGRPVVFLDFDGVLSPIVPDPDEARPTRAAKAAVARLAEVAAVGIVSGRGLDDVVARMGIDGLAYAGSHGFEMIDWEGERHEHEGGVEALALLDEATDRLDDIAVEGVEVERKRFAVAVHTRRARSEAARRNAATATSAVARELGLELTVGKEVHEVRPDVGWNKGTTVADLLTVGSVPLYIGDDTTDEDALAMVRRLEGIGIRVGEPSHPAETWARLRLDDPSAVAAFLGHLADRLGPAGS
jgi:trehalose 6-phosphate phosphatase